MTFVAEQQSIESRLNAQWSLLEDAPKIVWPNTHYKPQKGTPYLQMRVQNVTSERAGFGSLTTQRYRYYGLIIITIYLPENQGVGTINQYADELNTIFRDQQFDDIITQIPSMPDMGLKTYNGWYRQVVTIPFYRDEVSA